MDNSQFDPDLKTTEKDKAILRKFFDSNEPFMSGHQIISPIRRPDKEVPDWALDNHEVQRILLQSFPKMHTDPRQRRSAGRWARILYLYFRVYETDSGIAEEMNMTVGAVRSILSRIVGLAEDIQKGVETARKGRPKKVYR